MYVLGEMYVEDETMKAYNFSLKRDLNFAIMAQVAHSSAVATCANSLSQDRRNDDELLYLIARLYVSRVKEMTPMYSELFE
jgi:hypothetical protein